MSEIMTVVGKRSVVKGRLQGDEELTVFGRVEGSIHLTKTLIVESSGVVLADIDVRDAIISGVVVGNITATNSVQITEEGRMVGDISSPRFIIVDGASFKGHVDMGVSEGGDRERSPAPARPAPRATRSPAFPTRTPASAAPVRPAVSRPAPSRSAKAEPAKAEPAKAEPPKAAPAKAAPAKAEPAKAAPAKAEPAKAEPAKPQVPARPQAPKAAPPQKKDQRRPPRPPAMPAGKRKVRRR